MIVVDNRNTTPCVATIGFFDGVHLGHRYLIEQVRQAARERGLSSAVVTFPVHPRQVMQADYRPKLLLTPGEKMDKLDNAGVDLCFLLDFTLELSRLSARQFMALLKERFAVGTLIIGYDHRFGHGRSEGFDDYVSHGRELSMEVLPADAYSREAGAVSSSMIRRLLAGGDVAQAAQCLGYPYTLGGTVVDGYHFGRSIGYPTANLRPEDPDKLLPADGVYAVRATVDGTSYAGIMNIGFHPTVNSDERRSLEVHLLDFSGDLYRHHLSVAFVRRLRQEHRFDSIEDLARQLKEDEEEVRKAENEARESEK